MPWLGPTLTVMRYYVMYFGVVNVVTFSHNIEWGNQRDAVTHTSSSEGGSTGDEACSLRLHLL